MNKFAIGCGGLVVIVLFIAFIIALFFGGTYNRLVRSQQSVDQQWAQVQNVYQRRADLIPNLVNTVAGAANFEKSTLVEVTNARASVGRVQLDPNKAPSDAAQLQEFQAAQGQLSNALSRLLVVAENYPQLTATENFRGLHHRMELIGENNGVRYYDDSKATNVDAVVKSLEEEFSLRLPQNLSHLNPQRVLRAGEPVDEVLHVHPAADTGPPEPHALASSIDDLVALDA